MTTGLTERQLREKQEFDARGSTLLDAEINIDFDKYTRKEYGPWNPYWQLLDHVYRHTPPNTGGRLLSYGCGKGIQALIVAKKGYSVAGFDIADSLITIANKLAKKYGLDSQAEFTVQPAETLSYADESFDGIWGENILHHVELARAVPEMVRVLKPGGIAVFKDSMVAQFRNSIRKSPPISWILKPGVKCMATGARYTLTVDERPLNDDDLAIMRRSFSTMTLERYNLLAVMTKFFGRRSFFERCDWGLFKVLPFTRRFGDNVVIMMKK